MKNKFSNLTEKQALEIAKVINPNLNWSYEGLLDNEHFLISEGPTLHIYISEPTGSPYSDKVIELLEFDENEADDKVILLESEILNKIDEMVDVWTSNIHSTKSTFLKNFDRLGTGNIELIDINDVVKVLQKNQKKIIEIDRNYIHQFIKLNNYIKTKAKNIRNIFELVKNTKNEIELIDYINQIENQKHLYDSLVFHTLNMITALLNDDMITFFEIYEILDKLNIFNSNWENEVSEKLTNIGDKLDDLMHSIYNMELNIVSELSHLSYVTQESFEDLNRSVTSQLREVESSINTNNLLTGIQTYQLYKINKNTKGLR